MSSEWPFVRLGELTVNHDAKRRPVKASERKPGPFPYYGASGVVDHVEGYLFDGEYLLVAEDGENLRSRQTPIAFMAKGKFWVNNHAHIVTGNERAVTRFLSYALAAADVTAYLTGAVMPKLTQGNLNNIALPCPPVPVQREIVRLLGGLDDTIDVLRAENKVMEDISEALFRSWFVDFAPSKANLAGEAMEGFAPELLASFPAAFDENTRLPAGWSNDSLDKDITYLNGLALQKYPPVAGEATLPVIKIGQLKAGRGDPKVLASRKMKPQFIIKDGDIIFSWSGTLEVRIWTGGEGALNQHLFKVTSEKHPPWFCYEATRLHLDSFRGTAADKATTMGHIQRHHLTEAKVPVPPVQAMEAMSSVMRPLFELRVANGQAIRALEQLRDHLLPRLVDGRLSLDLAEEAVAAASGVQPEVVATV
jgi:type I restriction enzyme, S subunit